MSDEQRVAREEESEREKLFGAFRRLNAILRRSPTLDDLEITSVEDLRKLREHWNECWKAMHELSKERPW